MNHKQKETNMGAAVIKRTVWVTTSYSLLHRWESAPDEVRFLRYPHRHLFKAKVGVDVEGDDREVEFFMLRDAVEEAILRCLGKYITDGEVAPLSCEQMAYLIAEELLELEPPYKAYRASFIEISEDGENGATVIFGDARGRG